MKTIFDYTATYITSAFVFFIPVSCNNNAASKKGIKDSVDQIATTKAILKKPPGSFADTLIINFPAAVFYQPDSFQLLKIKAITDPVTFDGTMHEYFYQMRNGRVVIKKNWPQIKIIEATKYRYLLFIKKDNSPDCIDLDTKQDTHGLFVFDALKSPQLVDMTNIESIMGFYLSNQ